MHLLHGPEYALSSQKRFCDRLIAASLRPASFLVRKTLEHEYTQLGLAVPAAVYEKRIGAYGTPFLLTKYPTLALGTMQPISSRAARANARGLDELAQLQNIREGAMSFVGHRPLDLEHHEAVLDCAPRNLADAWTEMVLPTKPGEISTFGIRAHSTVTPEDKDVVIRMEDDIKDVQDGSIVYDLQLCFGALLVAVH